MKRKLVKMLVTVSVPGNQSAAFARREVRHLIKEGVGYYCNAGDSDGAILRGLKAVR